MLSPAHLRQTVHLSAALNTLSKSFKSCHYRLIHKSQTPRGIILTQEEVEEGLYRHEDLPATIWGLTDHRIVYSSHVKDNLVRVSPLELKQISNKIQWREKIKRRNRAIPLIVEQTMAPPEEEECHKSPAEEVQKPRLSYPYAQIDEIELPEEADGGCSDAGEDPPDQRLSIQEEISLRMQAYDQGVLQDLDNPRGNLVERRDSPEEMPNGLQEDSSADHLLMTQQGSADPSCPPSDVPCGGCGANLHCQQPSLIGFVPKELFEGRNRGELRNVLCQRCHFLRIHKTALHVRVDSDMYIRLLEPIKKTRSLILLVVDLLDVPCSIWPRIMDIIGTRKPVVVVGNKVDLLPADGKNHLKRIHAALVAAIEKTPLSRAQVKHVSLVSAHTGYGIESLITKIQHSWGTRGDIYIMGCTNSGKSTLFNALLGSDMCKTVASTLIRRATVSPWPGTTLSMLKFPILRPSGYRLYLRTQRLKAQQRMQQPAGERPLFTKNILLGTLSGHIGRTLEVRKQEEDSGDPFSTNMMRIPGVEQKPIMGINPADELYSLSKWCYDTPGTVQPEQLIHLLTHKELMKVLPNHLLRPMTFCLRPGLSLLLGGLARLDLLYSPQSVRFTVFTSDKLPLTITRTIDASAVYRQYLGSPLLGVPMGEEEERLRGWPALQPLSLRAYSRSKRESCADIILSSAGWVSLTGLADQQLMELRAWTPGGRGIHLRDPPMLPFAVTLRGPRIGKSIAYRPSKIFLPQ